MLPVSFISKMARIAVTLFSIFLTTCSALKLPPDGFWFNCGLDFCEFPAEYCRVIKGQRPSCQACTEDECNTLDTPSQCYSRCTELENERSEAVAKGGLLGVKEKSQTTLSDQHVQILGENRRLHIITWVLLSITIISILIVGVLLMMTRHDNKILHRRIKDMLGVLRPLTAQPQQIERFDVNENCNQNRIQKLALKRSSGIVIQHPIDDHMSSNLADYTLIDEHNLASTLNQSSRRQSNGTEETTTKDVFETNTSEGQPLLPSNTEIQVQQRPRSNTTELLHVTPTADPSESSITLSFDSRRGSSDSISTPDSGHYGTGNSSQTGSVDLKNNTTHRPATTVEQTAN